MAAKRNINKKQTFLGGAAVLVGATALVKIIGAIFKIPLGNLIGTTGMGYFSRAYDLYQPVYAVALAGMPIAVCRMVAADLVRQKYRDARQVLNVSKLTFFIIGIAAMSIIAAIAYPYVLLTGSPKESLISILAIAPCIFFCCIMSSHRGYYEGHSNMVPSAVSEIIEAMGKLILGLGLAYLAHRFYPNNPEYAAAGAILGITLGAMFGAIYLFLRYKLRGDSITQTQLDVSPEAETMKKTFKMLIVIAIPVILGSLASQITTIVDVMTVQSRLTGVVPTADSIKSMNIDMYNALFREATDALKEAFPAGFTSGQVTDKMVELAPTYLYGCYRGYTYSIYNLIPTITNMLGVSALPIMTTAWTEHSKEKIKSTMESILRITALISIPAGFGIAALSEGILSLLYPTQPDMIGISTPVLSFLGLAVVFSGITLTTTSLLQAIGKERLPVYNMLIGAGLKIIINFILVGIPSINIKGAAMGTLACYIYICVSDLYLTFKYSKVIPNMMKTFIKPLSSGALCGLAAWASCGLLEHFGLSVRLSTVCAMAIAVLVYLLSLGLLRVVTRDDIVMLPKGEKIASILKKLHCIK